MQRPVKTANWLWGLVGAIGGAVLGHVAFFILAQHHGIYALVLPGALAGLGCGAFSGGKSYPLGIVCGLLGLLAGILTEWRFAPFVADGSFGYFLAHLHHLRSLTQISLAADGLLGFWFGRGRAGGVWPRRAKQVAGE